MNPRTSDEQTRPTPLVFFRQWVMATVGNTPLRHLFGDPLADINAPCQCLVSYQVGNEPTRLTQKVKGRLYVDQTGLHIRGIVPIDLEFRAIKEIGFAHAVCKSELMVRSRMRVYLTPVHCYFGMLSLLNIYHMVHIYSRLHRQVGGKGRCAKCGYNMLMTKGDCPECGCDRVYPGMPLRS